MAGEAQFAEVTREVCTPLKERFSLILAVIGDVLKLGIGSGENFDYYPHGNSLSYSCWLQSTHGGPS